MKSTLVQGLERAVSKWHPPKTIFQNLIFCIFSNSLALWLPSAKPEVSTAQILEEIQSYYLGQIWALGPWPLTLRLWALGWLSCLLENQVRNAWPPCPLVEGTRASVLGPEIALSVSQGSFSLPWGLRRFPGLSYTLPRVVPCFFFLSW